MLSSFLIFLIFFQKNLASKEMRFNQPVFISGNTSPQLVKDIIPGKFLNADRKVCETHRPLRLALIIIFSKPDHFLNRNVIRNTWGLHGIKYNMPVFFIIGSGYNISTQNRIGDELKKYDDIILTNFMDTYRNLTLKTVSALHWVLDFCYVSEFVIKADDDVFVNIPYTKAFLKSLNPYKATIYGGVNTHINVDRVAGHKFYIPQSDYKQKKYPRYVMGCIYIIPTMVVKSLYDAALEEPFFSIEDIFLTGFVAKRLGIEIQQIRGIITSPKNKYLVHKAICVIEVYPLNRQQWLNNAIKY